MMQCIILYKMENTVVFWGLGYWHPTWEIVFLYLIIENYIMLQVLPNIFLGFFHYQQVMNEFAKWFKVCQLDYVPLEAETLAIFRVLNTYRLASGWT